MIFSPVLIPTLCRFEHFKRCVDSLANCTGADETLLVIALDFPSKEEHMVGYKKICDYISRINGFKEVRVLRRHVNYGATRNILDAKQYIYSFSETLIFTEDDNEFSPNFLLYINEGLLQYKSKDNVKAICGYTPPYPIKNLLSNIYVAYAYSAWGVGLWRDKNFYPSGDKKSCVEEVLFSWKKSMALFKLRARSLNNYISMYFRKKWYGDCITTSTFLLKKYFCIFPTISKVRNWGHDGSGEHCKVSDIYIRQEIDTEKDFVYDEIFWVENKNVRLMLNRTDVGFGGKIIVFIRYLFFRLIRRDIFAFYFKR